MGKTKPKYLRTIAGSLSNKHEKEFTTNFEENKRKVKEMNLIEYSKEERNKLAGEITQEMKKKTLREEKNQEAKKKSVIEEKAIKTN